MSLVLPSPERVDVLDVVRAGNPLGWVVVVEVEVAQTHAGGTSVSHRADGVPDLLAGDGALVRGV